MKYKFTLVEILVSMAVFSILLVLMMQFFSGAKTLWTANEKRATVYTDASAVLDFMTDMLQSTFCSFDATGETVTPFEIVKETDNDKIYFNSNSLINLGGGPVRYLSFQRGSGGNENVLYLKIFHDNNGSNTKFSRCFWEFKHESGTYLELDQIMPVIKTELNAEPDANNHKIISRTVTSLELTPLKMDGTAESDHLTVTPVAIRIKLTLMENETKLAYWKEITNADDKKKFKEQNEYTFYRTVWLGKRN